MERRHVSDHQPEACDQTRHGGMAGTPSRPSTMQLGSAQCVSAWLEQCCPTRLGRARRVARWMTSDESDRGGGIRDGRERRDLPREESTMHPLSANAHARRRFQVSSGERSHHRVVNIVLAMTQHLPCASPPLQDAAASSDMCMLRCRPRLPSKRSFRPPRCCTIRVGPGSAGQMPRNNIICAITSQHVLISPKL